MVILGLGPVGTQYILSSDRLTDQLRGKGWLAQGPAGEWWLRRNSFPVPGPTVCGPFHAASSPALLFSLAWALSLPGLPAPGAAALLDPVYGLFPAKPTPSF